MDYGTVKSLPAMFFQRADELRDQPFLWRKQEGEWRSLSWADVAERITNLAKGLHELGVKKGDRVVLVSENRPEWLIADVAIMAAGGITVPAYTTNTEDDHIHILADSGATAAIVSTAQLGKRLIPAAKRAPDTETIITIEPPAVPTQGANVVLWDDLLEKGKNSDFDVAANVALLKRDETSCIIYTSGTGGRPKGVMLSHGAIIHNCNGANELLKGLPRYGEETEVFLSFLPLSHSYEHSAGQFFPVSIGAEIYYAEGVEKLVNNMAEARPSIMTAVPRLYETIYGRIISGVNQAGGFKKTLFMKAVELGRKNYENPGSLGLGEKILNGLLNKLVRAKVAERFGGRLKAFVSGGAPLNYEIGTFFLALDVVLLQGYGQTESAPVVSCNSNLKIKIHTVGPPLANTEVKIAEDGEILVRGELVMQGYWHNTTATAAAIQDGWLHTGDIGEIDEDGYIQITDRKKDIIVNSGGDNLSPQRVEGILTVEPEIAQAMVYGDKKPNLVALIVPDPDFMKSWAKENGKDLDPESLIEDEAFKEVVGDAVDRVNAKLNNIERVRKFVMTAVAFTTENEMMTPSMKIRRHIIKANYGEKLEALYAR